MAVDLDLDALQASVTAEVGKMSLEDMRKLVLETRTRQRKNQAKQDPVKQKAYRLKRAAIIKAASEALKARGEYDSILEAAKKAADAANEAEIEVDEEDEAA